MNDEQMDALIETLESWGERADMPLSAIGSMHKAAKALTETRAELEASRRELFAYQADVEGANRRELSFATACVRNVEGITVGGALEMQRDEIASLRAELAELRRERDEFCAIVADRTEEISSLEFQLTQATAAAAVPDDVAKDAERYRACRYAALAADNDPLIEQMLDWPNVSTADEFDIQTDQIAAILAAKKEKGNDPA